MADMLILKPFIRSWEGKKYTNRRSDRGGPTKWGVTIGTYREVFGSSRTIADLKNLTEEEWDTVFRRFWNRWRADQIESQSVANLLVDWVWGSGKYGIVYPQQVLGVTPDGIVGPKTLKALNDADPSTLFSALWKRRKLHFENVASAPGQEVNLSGWLNRLNGIKYRRLVCNGGKVVWF